MPAWHAPILHERGYKILSNSFLRSSVPMALVAHWMLLSALCHIFDGYVVDIVYLGAHWSRGRCPGAVLGVQDQCSPDWVNLGIFWHVAHGRIRPHSKHLGAIGGQTGRPGVLPTTLAKKNGPPGTPTELGVADEPSKTILADLRTPRNRCLCHQACPCAKIKLLR